MASTSMPAASRCRRAPTATAVGNVVSSCAITAVTAPRAASASMAERV